jgi:acyl-CoA hydrolase
MSSKSQKTHAKAISESMVVMTELVLPQHTNTLGTVFGGTVMSWIDIAASIAAQRHAGSVCVTASVDELHFLKAIKEGYIVNIRAFLTCVHRTSCEVMVVVGAENPKTGEKFHTTTALLTFVSLDENGKSQRMPELITQTDEEKAIEKSAKERKEQRQKYKKLLLEQSKRHVGK